MEWNDVELGSTVIESGSIAVEMVWIVVKLGSIVVEMVWIADELNRVPFRDPIIVYRSMLSLRFYVTSD